MNTDLSTYNNSDFNTGSTLKKFCWYYVSIIFFRNALFPFYGFKIFLLKLFGAKVGKAVVIKPNVNIKYPWLLTIGNFSWLGENVWIDNLDMVVIGSNVCISQGALLLCGNHNYKVPQFTLITKPITLEDGVWIGAKAMVCGGAVCKSHAVLTVGSVTSATLQQFSIYKGNPAVKIKDRVIS